MDPEGTREASAGAAPLLRFGSFVGAATLASALATVPAVLRAAGSLPSGCGSFEAWAALVTAALVPMLVVMWILARAKVGLRALVPTASDARVLALGVAIWVGLETSVLIVLGALLRATTHHHALAGVTFAVGALLAGTLFAPLAARVARAMKGRSAALRAGAWLTLALPVAAVAVLARGQSAGLSAAASSIGPRLVDTLAFVGAAALFGLELVPLRRRLLALLGPPVAAIALAVGISALRSHPGLANTLGAPCRLLAAMLARLG